jgi:ribose 5-phosphate isomerase RpiB
MKNFLVQIWAYDYHAKFTVLAEDSASSIEQAIIDKLGKKSIKWESTGMFRDTRRITYEEVKDDRRPIQTKTVLGVEVAVGV